MNYRFAFQCLLAGAGLLTALPAMAQAIPSAENGPASAARAQRDIETKQLAPGAPSHIEVKQAAIQKAPAGAEKIKFKLRSLTLEGVTAYPQGALEATYADKIGQTISLADLYEIAGNLTRKYRNDGYVLTQVVVPPQTIEDGTVHLRVVEGYIDHVEVRGDENSKALDIIRRYADHVRTEGRALNINELERAMLLANDLPGLDARGILTPSANKVGAADLIVDTKRHLYDAQVGIDNYGSKFLGPWEVTAAGALNSALGLNERISGQLVYAPGQGLERELAYGGIDYEQPIFSYGTTMEFFASDTDTAPNYLLRQFDVKGNSFLAGARIKHPFIRTRNFTFTGRGTFDFNNVNSQDDIAPSRHDHIRSARIGGRLEYLDTFFNAAYNVVDFEASHGLGILDTRDSGSLNVSRPGASPEYLKFSGEMQRLQQLTPTVNLLLGLTGQYSNNLLYTSEQFGVGGANYGRGYDPSEITGDSGFAGKAELQWNNPYPISYLAKYQLFGFYDMGKVWNHDATTSAEARSSLASAGAGFRIDFTPSTTGGFLVAQPLTHGVQSENGHEDPRFLFSLYQKF